MNTITLPKRSGNNATIPAEAIKIATRQAIAMADGLLGAFVIGLGMGLGAIAVVIIGLSTGWIPFSC